MRAGRRTRLSFSPHSLAAGNLLLCTPQEQSANQRALSRGDPDVLLPAARWIWARGRVHIHMQMGCRINPRRIAVPIRIVVAAHAREVFAARRLRELPNLGKWHTTLGRFWFGHGTAWRWRADVIGNPVRNPPSFCIGMDVLGCSDTGL